jgi:pyruvate,water dikinase
MAETDARYVIPFRELDLSRVPEVGGKNASLGELIRNLDRLGVRVPDGFALTGAAFRLHLREAGIEEEIYAALDDLDVRDLAALERVGRFARERVRSARLPAALVAEVESAYLDLSRESGEEATDVAVRSSATAEDLPNASFAGQQETFLNVHGLANLLHAIEGCMASLFTDRAIVYRSENGFPHRGVLLSVGVQKMVRSDQASAGVIFTLDTETGFRDVVLVTGAWGLGETVVQGAVNPDEYWVHKPTLRSGHRPIVRREIGEKAIKLVYDDRSNQRAVKTLKVPAPDRSRAVLTDDEVLELSRWALAIEDHYSKLHGRPTPMDIEWAKDGPTGQLFIVQARPETVHSQRERPKIEIFKLRGKGEVLARGKSVGGKVGVGPVRVLDSLEELATFREGEVLVAAETGPDWEPVLRRAAAVVTDKGGRTCHAAIVSRELGLPCVVGTQNGTRVLETGSEVTVSCAEGDEGRVYAGRIDFDRQEIDPERLARPRVPLMLNVGNPETAFHRALLPSAGVGLARMELIVLNSIGIHPMALVHPDRVTDREARRAIRERIRGSESGVEFFVSRLATGVAQLAAAFFPRPVILRFSDFKTNEYRELLGGDAFEPVEANPMLGFRGASRYYSDLYREGFALECAAVRRVREDMGLVNLKLMVPFCRTLEEARRVLLEMEKNGLRRGEDELEVYVMCEIPSNVILAEDFAELFDGFSIGSNDLTQLTLGVDRDSELLAPLFDERDPAVKALVRQVVQAAHRKHRKVGLCGQAPSDHPEYAEFLAEIGIDSISLSPDALAAVAARLAARE